MPGNSLLGCSPARCTSGGPHLVYECDGTPTDCVRAGLLGGLAADADLVVSGINHGANVAADVVYSSTVGAGPEAAVLGTSALCLSQQTPAGSLRVKYTEHPGPGGTDYDFALAARHGSRWRPHSCGRGRARRSCSVSTTPPPPPPADTDVAALRRGLISVTPLSVAIGLDEFSPADDLVPGPAALQSCVSGSTAMRARRDDGDPAGARLKDWMPAGY